MSVYVSIPWSASYRPVNAESICSDSHTILRFPAITDGKYKTHKDSALFCVKGWLKDKLSAFPYKVENSLQNYKLRNCHSSKPHMNKVST